MDAEADARSDPALDARRDDESPAAAPGGRVSDDYARELNELRRVTAPMDAVMCAAVPVLPTQP